jgi:hypothetical protein
VAAGRVRAVPGEGRPCYRHLMEIIATAQTFAEALTHALNQIVELDGSASPPLDATLAVPLRAREPALPAVAAAMVGELLAEIGDGISIGSVQIDGMMKRDGDFICWGYAFAAPQKRSQPSKSLALRDLQVSEEPGQFEIRFTLEQSSEPVDRD